MEDQEGMIYMSSSFVCIHTVKKQKYHRLDARFLLSPVMTMIMNLHRLKGLHRFEWILSFSYNDMELKGLHRLSIIIGEVGN
jgi:hypothetical protein